VYHHRDPNAVIFIFILFYFFTFFESIYNKKSKIAFQRRQKNIQRCGSFNVSAKVHYCVREKRFRAKLLKI